VQYRTLDLERTPEEQGFAPGQFDIVLAANVLHATADACAVCGTTRLLAPGGHLVLLEAAGPRRMLDLIFGLTEGWWKFADHDLRPNYPLSAARWLDLFAELGLTDAVAVPASSGSETSADQVVLLARRGTGSDVAAGFSLRQASTQAEAAATLSARSRGLGVAGRPGRSRNQPRKRPRCDG
jgi:SAM-dependent methyltransferase